MSGDEFAKKAIELFEEYKCDLGCDDFDSIERQEEYQEKMSVIVCEYHGHEFGPDQCNKPEHDHCYRCDQLASKLGYERDGSGGYVKVG